MQTVTIEITNQNALKLLKELEDLHLIRLIKGKGVKRKGNLAEQFASVLPSKLGKQLHKHTLELRKEWERGF